MRQRGEKHQAVVLVQGFSSNAVGQEEAEVVEKWEMTISEGQSCPFGRNFNIVQDLECLNTPSLNLIMK